MYNHLCKISKNPAPKFAREMVHKDPKASLESAAWTIIGKTAADEDAGLFERYVPYAFGSKRYWYCSAMAQYLKKVKSDESFRRCAEVFATMVITEGLRQYRSIYGSFLFQAATEYKNNGKSENAEEAETAKKRLELMKPILQRILDEESDPEAVTAGKKKMSSLFE